MKSLSLALERATRHQAMAQFVDEVGYHPIRLQEKKGKDEIQCNTCNRRCLISPYNFGLCNAVFNARDELISTTYGLLVQGLGSIEHIERVGFWHYKPGMTILCPINLHCNFGCVFCYQRQWSHTEPSFYISGTHISVQDLVETAIGEGAEGIAFSMAEPTMFFDFIIDVASLAKEVGLDVVMNSNGYMTPEAIELLSPLLGAVCISVKGLGDIKMYDKWLLTGPANPSYVLQSIKLFHEQGVHVEVTGIFTRSDCEMGANAHNLSTWLANNVDRQLPLALSPLVPWMPGQRLESFHVSTKESKKLATLCRHNGLWHVYDMAGDPNLVTRCHGCGSVLIKRQAKRTIAGDVDVILTYVPETCGLDVVNNEGYCKRCGTKIYGKFQIRDASGKSGNAEVSTKETIEPKRRVENKQQLKGVSDSSNITLTDTVGPNIALLDALVQEMPSKFGEIFGLPEGGRRACASFSRLLAEVLSEFGIHAEVRAVYALLANQAAIDYQKGKTTREEALARGACIQIMGSISTGQALQHAVCYIPNWNVVVDLALESIGLKQVPGKPYPVVMGGFPWHAYWAIVGRFPWWVQRFDFKDYALVYTIYEAFPAGVAEAKKVIRGIVKTVLEEITFKTEQAKQRNVH